MYGVCRQRYFLTAPLICLNKWCSETWVAHSCEDDYVWRRRDKNVPSANMNNMPRPKKCAAVNHCRVSDIPVNIFLAWETFFCRGQNPCSLSAPHPHFVPDLKHNMGNFGF
jgi:hypothetical protein